VTSFARAARPAASVEAPVRLITDAWTILSAELIKLRHDPVELATRAVQPLLWLLVFGQVLANMRAVPTGDLPYLDYLAPGILAQSALFMAIFFGINVIWERDFGILQKVLASPASRSGVVLGKAAAGSVRGLAQAAIVYLVSYLIGVHLRLEPLPILGVCVIVSVGSALFASLSMLVATVVRSRERFMGIGQIMTMPLFFASSAIYPVALMPPWLQVVAQLNPLTYMVDGIRTLMIVGATSARGVGVDFAVLAVGLVVLVAVTGRRLPKLAE
jgi:ABC-2 type transport system permease protein